MFKKNPRSKQPLLLSDVQDLPARNLKYLENSWAATFRREVFLRIPEDRFAVLYDPDPSRPNTPVNILVGLNVLKEWHNWSDEEMYEHYLFDLQVRYALGCDAFGEGDFELRTMYNFRHRVSEHALKTGENLFQVVFEEISDEQIQKWNINTKIQRMDSTQILSNIADLSRLELLVMVMQRLHRILSEAEQAQYAQIFQPFVKESAGQYTYRIKGKEAVWERIQQVGAVLYQVLQTLANAYQEHAVYQVAARFFEENFKLVETQVQAKTNAEIQPGCLQSLDDVEAGFRRKGHHTYKGYVANVSETCDPGNPLQLITQVQVQSNPTSDIELLEQALPELKWRMELEQLVTDGAYTGPTVDKALRTHRVEQITTGLIGALPVHPNGQLSMSDFEMDIDQEENLVQLTCPADKPPSWISSRVASRTSSSSVRPTARPVPSIKLVIVRLTNTNERRPSASTCRKVVFSPVCASIASGLAKQKPEPDQPPKQPSIKSSINSIMEKSASEGCIGPLRHPVAALGANLRRIFRYEHDKQRGNTSKKNKEVFSAPVFRFLEVWIRPLQAAWNRRMAAFCY